MRRTRGTRTSRRIRRSALVAAGLVAALAAGSLAGPAFAAPAPAPAPVTAPGPDAEALSDALAGLPDHDVTAALVRVDGHGGWRGTAGVRDVRTGAPALENARFRAGSVTKVVTAAIVLQLAAEGRIDLDGTVRHYLPGLLTGDFEKPVTVRQLLNYTSGLWSGASSGDTGEEDPAHRFGTRTPRQVVAEAVARGPAYPPGARQTYGNIHYTVLGLLIEEVTGDSYAHQARVRIFRPLGMRHSSFPAAGDTRIHGPHNRGYDWIDGKLVDVTEWDMTDRFAAGDLISTTADLERLLVALFRGRVVPEPQLREMFTPPFRDARYGAALERTEVNGKEVWGKGGSRPGCVTVIAATEDLSRTLVYAVNSTDAKGAGQEAAAERFALPAFKR
ncbi:serine hydrolase domain-containing protein [Streptomyces sp. NPDC038707]|uniref:serine hydrolase domain-containing protein n=1 Tax=unclassified Streptomyces TaxID=2593676 RepID=UPI0033CBAD83